MEDSDDVNDYGFMEMDNAKVNGALFSRLPDSVVGIKDTGDDDGQCVLQGRSGIDPLKKKVTVKKKQKVDEAETPRRKHSGNSILYNYKSLDG